MKHKMHYGDYRPAKKGRFKRWFYSLLLLLFIGAILTYAGVFRSSAVDSRFEKPLSKDEIEQLIPRGRELALAGDCFGCHSRPNGPMGAGGVEIKTPFGTIFSTNITPDRRYGIGSYSREDFHRAMKWGIGKDKGNLYPAMPFVFTHITNDRDIDALYAYLKSIPAMAVPNAKNSGVFALPVRRFMNFWTLFNFPNRTYSVDRERSTDWNRGAYLVEGLAHCGACHTPRNFMMGVKFSKALEGGYENGLSIPNITAKGLAKRGYNIESLKKYLETGISEFGTAFLDMETVVKHSTSQMNERDVTAIATYLMTSKDGRLLNAQESPVIMNQVAGFMKKGDKSAGYDLYISACSNCHGLEGEGIPNVAPGLKNNGVIEMSDPATLISVVLNGLPTTNYTNGQRMYAMPAFVGKLSHKEIADILTWLRETWGNQQRPDLESHFLQQGLKSTPEDNDTEAS